MNKFLILPMLALLAIFSSCENNDEYQPIGKWDDHIKLSSKSATLKPQTDSVVFTTKGTGWWINTVECNDSSYWVGIDKNSKPLTSIQKEYFTVTNKNNSLFVKFNENKTGKERHISITLQAGNYFDYVTVKQE